MRAGGERFPRRFRRRLALTFMAVAAAAAGALALVSFLLAREYRIDRFEARARRETELNLRLHRDSGRSAFAGLVEAYRRQDGLDAVVGGVGPAALRSRADLALADVPEGLRAEVRSDDLAPDETVAASTEMGDVHYLVVGGKVRGSPAELYVFFSLEELLDSLSEFRTSLLIGWVIVATGAALVGQVVARRTLRPVGDAAAAAHALAEGLLDTRLEVANDDEFGAWATYFNDMAQALADKLRALSEASERERRFTADVAHELRTPLSALANASSVLSEELARLPPDLRRPTELVSDGIKRLRRLVEDLLELSRLDAGHQQVDLEPLELDEAVDAIVRAGGWEGKVSVDAERVTALSDRHRLDRVVGNLISNACSHGGGDVEVRVRDVGGRAIVEVADRGPGIAPEELSNIFDRFQKGTSSDRAGSGLGLAIASENARVMGADITVSSEAGGGSVFSVVMPRLPRGEKIDGTVISQ